MQLTFHPNQNQPMGVPGETMGRRIRSQRVLWGMSQEELAAKLGIAPTYLSKIENDHRSEGLTLKTLRGVAEATGASLDWLVYGKGER